MHSEDQVNLLQDFFKNVSRTPNPKQLADLCYELNKISGKNKHDMRRKGLKSIQIWFDLQRLSTPKRRKSLTTVQKCERQQFRKRLTKSTSSDGVGASNKKLTVSKIEEEHKKLSFSPAKNSRIPIRKHKSQTTPTLKSNRLKLKPKSPIVLTAAENKKRHVMKLRKTIALSKLAEPISPVNKNMKTMTSKTVPKSLPVKLRCNPVPNINKKPKQPLAAILSAHELSHRRMEQNKENTNNRNQRNSWSTPKKLEIKPELSLTLDRTEPWELMNDSNCPKQLERSKVIKDNKIENNNKNDRKSMCTIC